MMTATLSMGGVVGSATPAASAWVKSADPWPTRISVLHPALGRAGADRVCDTYVGVPHLGRLCWESGCAMHNQTRSAHDWSLASRAGGRAGAAVCAAQRDR